MQRRTITLSLLLLFLAACNQLEDTSTTSPGSGGSDALAPTGTFGVSASYGGPYQNDAAGSIENNTDARIVNVAPGGKFFVQVNYEDTSGVTDIAVNLVNSSPEGLAGTLDPSQSFFTLGEPTGISEPNGCDLSDGPKEVSCIYEVRVAEDAVNIGALDGSEGEFAYVFRTKVTDAAGNTSDKAERGYVVVTGGDGDKDEPTPQPETCTNPVNIPDEALLKLLREDYLLEQPITCEDLESLSGITYAGALIAGIRDLEGLQYATNLQTFYLITDDEDQKATLISDLSPLAGLIKLRDITLDTEGDTIADISPLRNLVNLETLDLDGNKIEDIGVLANLTALTTVNLGNNNISDLSPLVDNVGLGEGDSVDLRGNPLETCPGDEDRTGIDALIERGVEVSFDESKNCDTDNGDSQVVEIPDSVLERVIRNEIGKAEGDLTKQDLAELVTVQYEGKFTVRIQSLEGLQFAVNLENLDIPFNGVTDLTPLLDNPGLGEGDAVNLVQGGLETCPGTEDREDIDTLIERGVQVSFDEPRACGPNEGKIVVTSTSGEADVEDECTLRDAITAANTDTSVGGCFAAAGTNTIILENVTYTLSEVDNNSDGPTGLPSVTADLTIEGNGATIERQEGAPDFRLLHIADASIVSAEDLNLRGGSLPDSVFVKQGEYREFRGAGIYNEGQLSLERVRVSENSIGEEGKGAGIYNTGELFLTESQVLDNTIGFEGAGAGIYNTRVLSVEEGLVADNFADEGYGGGVVNTDTGVLDMSNSVVRDNNANFGGGGIGNSGLARIGTTTIRNNSGEFGGGGISNSGTLEMRSSALILNGAGEGGGGGLDNGGTASLVNVTVSGNLSTFSDGEAIRQYGGTLDLIHSTVVGTERTDPLSSSGLIVSSGGTLTLSATIILNQDPEVPNCVGTILSEGYNIDSDGSCNFNQDTDSKVDPQLGALEDNGGLTLTHALQADSPAIDAVPANACEVRVDQRVVERPQGGACDIGAFELEQ